MKNMLRDNAWASIADVNEGCDILDGAMARLKEYAEVLVGIAVAAKPRWICEFCYTRAYVDHLPESWQLVFQSAVCIDCAKRVANDGGFSVVKGGAYAEVPDPRPQCFQV